MNLYGGVLCFFSACWWQHVHTKTVTETETTRTVAPMRPATTGDTSAEKTRQSGTSLYLHSGHAPMGPSTSGWRATRYYYVVLNSIILVSKLPQNKRTTSFNFYFPAWEAFYATNTCLTYVSCAKNFKWLIALSCQIKLPHYQHLHSSAEIRFLDLQEALFFF